MFDRLTAPITAAVAAHLGVPEASIRGLYAPPAKGIPADIALPCFQLAKAKSVAPPVMAVELAAMLTTAGIPAVPAGPFCNITFAAPSVATRLLPELATDSTRALRSAIGADRRACVDFSSPNIAKHLAFHHIRSTMIGNALAHCYKAAGWQVTRINFLGDWGTAFGRLIAGWKREGLTLDLLRAAPDQVTFLNDLYVRISAAAKADPVVEEEARHWSKALEDGHGEARSLWQLFKEASLHEFARVYGLLGVEFDSWNGEAYYEDKMGPLLNELETKNLSSISQGATIVDLPTLAGKQFKIPALLKRADGGTLYATRDLTASDDRFREFTFDRSLYIVDLGQSLHFQQWFAIAKLLQRPYADRLRHIGFGVVLMWNDEPGEGLEPGWAKGRSRGGKVMLLREVLEEAIERAAVISAEKNPGLSEEERALVARQVGVGAVVFNDLKNSRTGDVKFKFEEALRFDGETGPYLQFSHARLCSVIIRATGLLRNPQLASREELIEALVENSEPLSLAEALAFEHDLKPELLSMPAEKEVLLSIAKLQGALERTVDLDEPSILAQALLALASAISVWLTNGNRDHSARVLISDRDLCNARRSLAIVAKHTLCEGLRLLGLGAPERM